MKRQNMSKRFVGAALLVFALAVVSEQAAAWDCYGGFNPNATCSSQTTTLGSCLGCCEIIFDCRLVNGKSIHVAPSEFSACNGHCITDFS